MQDYAAQEEIGSSFQQFRPQTIMMQTRAVGTQFITDENYGEAIEEIRAAIDELNDFYSDMGREEMVDNSMEVPPCANGSRTSKLRPRKNDR